MAKKNKLDNSNLASKKLASEKKDSGAPGGGRGRKDEVGRSGVYPFSSPRAPKQAEVRAPGSWSQGQRGAASYEDHGGSELTYEGGRLLGALEEGGGNLAAHSETGSVEIPPEEWLTFFNGFSRQHEGWLTSLTVKQGEEQKTELRDCRLEGVSADHLTARDEIYLLLNRGDGGHIKHPVRNPMKVVFRQDLKGAHEGIDIFSAEATLTSIRFRIPARPETLDGVLMDPQHERARQSHAGTVKGKEFTADVPGHGTATMRFFVSGRRLYKLMVVGTGKSPEPHDVAKFLDSFRITG